MFIAVFIISLLTGLRITRPIKKLTGASGRILEGELNTRVDIKRNDEIGVLAGTFNRMSEELYKIDTGRKRFVSDVSHELKTPLASVKALVESLMEGEPDNETYREYLQDINSEIDRLSNLVKSLLTAARLEELQIKPLPVNINAVVEGLIRVFTPLAAAAGIILQNECKKEIQAELDVEMFKEVLINLIDNGIKYGTPGGFVKIGTESDGGGIALYVEDNGTGISKDELPYIFENFYRVDKTRTRDSGGNGIGLFIVKRICDRHGWDLSVKSEPGRGTRFEITLGRGKIDNKF